MITSYLISMFFSLRGLLRRLFMAGQCNEHVSSLLQICWESICGMSAIIHHCRFPTLITFSWGAYKSSFWCVSLCVCVSHTGNCAWGWHDLHLQSFMLRVSWNPGRHSQEMPPFCVSLQMCAQPWFLSMQVGPSFVPSGCAVKETARPEFIS